MSSPEEKIVIGDNDGSILIRIPLGDVGSAFFAFKEVEHFKNDEINTVLHSELYPLGGEPVRMTSRINVLSASAKEAYLRALMRLLPEKNPAYEKAFTEAIELLKEKLNSLDDSLWLEDAKAEQAEMLFNPFLVKGAASVLFGKGGGAKTYLSLRLALSLASKQPFMGFHPKEEVKTLFLDYEDISGTFASRIHHLWTAEPHLTSVETNKKLRYLQARGVPLPDLAPTLKKIIREHDIGFMIIDSAVSACGGEPERADTVARYFNSLASLGVTSLTIAHETKSENHAYPFGSVFWYNFPRSIWNVRSMREDDDMPVAQNVIETGLFHRKANNGPINPAIPLRVTFGNDKEGKLEKVTFARGSDDTWETEKSIPSRIRRLLKQGAKSTSELAEEMGDVNLGALKSALTRERQKGNITLLGTKGSPWIITMKDVPKDS